eukprot:scaffold55933_cov54-Phaeocystis_antarctica.AAC.1
MVSRASVSIAIVSVAMVGRPTHCGMQARLVAPCAHTVQARTPTPTPNHPNPGAPRSALRARSASTHPYPYP